jgi:hypothetical protein
MSQTHAAAVDPAALCLYMCACAVSDAFMKLLSNPYDLSEKVLPNDYSIARAGLRPQVRGSPLTVTCVSDMHACELFDQHSCSTASVRKESGRKRMHQAMCEEGEADA